MKPVVFTILFFVTTALAAVCPPKDESRSQILRQSLPTHVKPIRYNIILEPDIDNKRFDGTVNIQLGVMSKTTTITLHANALNLTDVKIDPNTNANEITAKYDSENEFLIIEFSKSLETQNYVLQLEYSGVISDTIKDGFYLASYTDKAGKEHKFATTQFEKTGARRAFPCFDEPHFKAKFIVSIIRNETYRSLSNEELVATKRAPSQGMFIDTFRETRDMSTYLLAFIVSEYVSTEVQLGQRVFADKDSIDNGDGLYALETGINVVEAMEKFTGIRYSFSKLDQVAIPDKDFDAGAMENWGLVTYRKSKIVFPFDYATTYDRETTVSIIAHEFAHQWFGNLVTCASWTYLWLNEGFADYFEYFIPIMLNWDMEGLFVIDSVQSALDADSDPNIQPMNSEKATSIINYQKAGSVIRMLSHMVTPDIFQKSLQHYLSKHAYQAVEPDHLYTAFQEILVKENMTYLINNSTVNIIMKTWDSNPGYPLLTVTRNYTTGEVKFQQKRFYTDSNTVDPSNTIWRIPINYVHEGANNYSYTYATHWLTSKDMTLSLELTQGWILFNKQHTGYYRIMYDDENWKRLSDQLNKDHTQIHTFNKAQLLGDLFTFAHMGLKNYTHFLDFTKFLKTETAYVPISIFLKRIELLDERLAEENGRQNFKKYLLNLVNGDALKKVSMSERDNESNTDQYLRVELMNWLCKYGDSQCKSFALDNFKSKTPISPTLQATIYCGAIRAGSQKEWDDLYSMYKLTTDAKQRAVMLNGLGCSENNATIQGFLDKALNTNLPATEKIDSYQAFRAVAVSGDAGVKFEFDYVINNFTKLTKEVYLESILTTLGSKLNTPAALETFKNLTIKYPDQASKINAAIKHIETNLEWNNKTTLNQWFDTYVSDMGGDGGGGGGASIQFDFSLKIFLGIIFFYVSTKIVN